MKELSKLSIELEINFKMDILKVSKAKARKGGIKMNPRIDIVPANINLAGADLDMDKMEAGKEE